MRVIRFGVAPPPTREPAAKSGATNTKTGHRRPVLVTHCPNPARRGERIVTRGPGPMPEDTPSCLEHRRLVAVVGITTRTATPRTSRKPGQSRSAALTGRSPSMTRSTRWRTRRSYATAPASRRRCAPACSGVTATAAATAAPATGRSSSTTLCPCRWADPAACRTSSSPAVAATSARARTSGSPSRSRLDPARGTVTRCRRRSGCAGGHALPPVRPSPPGDIARSSRRELLGPARGVSRDGGYAAGGSRRPAPSRPAAEQHRGGSDRVAG